MTGDALSDFRILIFWQDLYNHFRKILPTFLISEILTRNVIVKKAILLTFRFAAKLTMPVLPFL
ncbi:MAG TPA: hypothetical protein DEP00_01150 [Lachnospiraceae bacterium]|nr:hypothetical protein [Lachnospiraceae bacterium]